MIRQDRLEPPLVTAQQAIQTFKTKRVMAIAANNVTHMHRTSCCRESDGQPLPDPTHFKKFRIGFVTLCKETDMAIVLEPQLATQEFESNSVAQTFAVILCVVPSTNQNALECKKTQHCPRTQVLFSDFLLERSSFLRHKCRNFMSVWQI